MHSSNQGILGSTLTGDMKLELRYRLVESTSEGVSRAAEVEPTGERADLAPLGVALLLCWN
jgi:hypothetical protein